MMIPQKIAIKCILLYLKVCSKVLSLFEQTQHTDFHMISVHFPFGKKLLSEIKKTYLLSSPFHFTCEIQLINQVLIKTTKSLLKHFHVGMIHICYNPKFSFEFSFV